MTTFAGIVTGTLDIAAKTAAEAAAETDDKDEQAAAFRKELTRTALSMTSSWVMEAQDLLADMEDDDDEN